LLNKANTLSKDKATFEASQQAMQASSQNANMNANMTQEEKEHEMAVKLSETFRILEQQEKRAAEEKNQIGHDLFMKANDMLKTTTAVAEEAGIKLASGISTEEAADSNPQTEAAAATTAAATTAAADNNAADNNAADNNAA